MFLPASLSRQMVDSVMVDGFFPRCEVSAAPKQGNRVGIQEIGLAYESDPAVTHHLAEFVRRNDGRLPSAVLFNGGVMKATGLRRRVLEVLSSWSRAADQTPAREIEGSNLDLAVANAASDDVSVLLGNGDGTFQAPLAFPAGREPWSVVAADLDARGGHLHDLVRLPVGPQRFVQLPIPFVDRAQQAGYAGNLGIGGPGLFQPLYGKFRVSLPCVEAGHVVEGVGVLLVRPNEDRVLPDGVLVASRSKELARLPQHYADMFGWQELALLFAEAYGRLSPEEQADYKQKSIEGGLLDAKGNDKGDHRHSAHYEQSCPPHLSISPFHRFLLQ